MGECDGPVRRFGGPLSDAKLVQGFHWVRYVFRLGKPCIGVLLMTRLRVAVTLTGDVMALVGIDRVLLRISVVAPTATRLGFVAVT